MPVVRNRGTVGAPSCSCAAAPVTPATHSSSRAVQSQPLDRATPTASMRLRLPVLVMAADR